MNNVNSRTLLDWFAVIAVILVALASSAGAALIVAQVFEGNQVALNSFETAFEDCMVLVKFTRAECVEYASAVVAGR